MEGELVATVRHGHLFKSHVSELVNSHLPRSLLLVVSLDRLHIGIEDFKPFGVLITRVFLVAYACAL